MLSHLAFVCTKEGRPCPLYAVGCTEVRSTSFQVLVSGHSPEIGGSRSMLLTLLRPIANGGAEAIDNRLPTNLNLSFSCDWSLFCHRFGVGVCKAKKFNKMYQA